MLRVRPFTSVITMLAAVIAFTASRTPAVTGDITGYTVWDTSGSPYTVTGDIIVDTGDTLVIDAGVTVVFTADSDDQAAGLSTTRSEIYVNNGGRLYVNGTADDSVTFTSTGTGTDDWYGIVVYNASAIRLSHCTLEYAYYCIYANGTSADTNTVSNCRMSSCYYGIYNQQNLGSAWVIDSNRVVRPSSYAFYLRYPSYTTVSNNYIDCSNNATALYLRYSTGGNDSTCYVTDNTLVGNNNGYGIWCRYYRAVITGNVVDNFYYGIYYDWNQNTAVVMPVSGNTITDGTYGVYLTNYSTPPITGNSIYGQSSYQLYTLVADSVITATGNWWGTTTTAEMEAASNPRDITGIYDAYDNDDYGYVDYSGWLDAEGGSPAPTSGPGSVALTDNAQAARLGYGFGDTAWVRVEDTDLDTGAATAENVTVYLGSETETAPEALVLTETGASTGVFTGYMVLDSSGSASSDGELQVVKNDFVTVTYYEDANRYDDPDTLTYAARYGVTLASGDLTGRTVWTLGGSPYLVTGDVLLYAGDTLVVEPGVEVLFAPKQDDQSDGADAGLTEIYVYTDAFLYAVGTGADSITFTSNAADPAEGDWYGIRLYGSAAARIRYCAIEYAMYGVYGGNNNTDTIRVSDCRISDCDYGVYVTYSYDGVFWEIDGNYITNTSQSGVYCSYPTYVTVSNNTIESAANYGINFQYYYNGNDSSATVTGNTVDGLGTGTGIYSYRCRPAVTGNAVTGFSNGIYFYSNVSAPNPVTVTGNDVSDVQSCVYINQYVGGSFTGNTFGDYSSYAFYCQSYHDVTATGNYWGEDATAEMEAGGNPKDIAGIYDVYNNGSYGTVDYSGWLNAPGGIPATGDAGAQVMIADSSASEPAYFTASDTLYLTVADADENADTSAVDTVTAFLSSTTESQPETLVLPETGANTGLFRRGVPVDASAVPLRDGSIQAVAGDYLYLTFLDQANLYGQPDTVTDDALYAPVTVSGEVSGDVTWDAASGPYMVTGDVVVAGGNSLTILPGTEVYFMAGQDDQATGRSASQAEIYVNTDGRLNALGTADSVITFTSAAGSPAVGDWGDVYVNGTGTLRMDHCRITYASYGVYTNGTSIDSVVIRNTEVTETQYGIYVNNNGPSCQFIIDSCRVARTSSQGMYVYYGRSVSITGCTIDTTGSYGIYAYYYYNTEMLISGNTFNGTGADRAIYCQYCRPDITDNVFNDWQYGVYCNLSSTGYGTEQEISGNTFTGGTYGVYVNSGSQPTIVRNTFDGQSGYGVYNGTSADIDARNNWWGTATTAEMAATAYPGDIGAIFDYQDNISTGNVHYFGWLDAEDGSPVDSAFDGDMKLVDALGTDKIYYAAGDSIRVMVTDADLNADPGAADTVLVLLSSPAEAVPETLALVELSADTGVFTGVMPLEASASGTVDGVLQAAVDDMVTAEYDEARNAYGVAVTHTDDARFGMNPVSGGISGRTEWTAAGGPYLVTGDVLVEDGDTLVVAPGAKIYFMDNSDDQAAGRSTSLSEIVVDGGYLEAAGTADSTILFTSYATSPAEGDWSGVLFESEGGGVLFRCRFEYALYAVFSRDGVSGDVTLGQLDVYDAYTALYVDNGGTGRSITADSLRLHATSSTGIYLDATYSDVTVSGCTVDSSLNTGIYVYGSQVSDNVAVTANVIRGTGAYMGVYCNVARPAVTDNVIENCSDGIRCYNSSSGMPTAQDISGNTVTGGSNGLAMYYYVAPAVNYNNFIGQSSYAVYQDGYEDIDARYNYWGATGTADMDAGGNPKDIGVIYDNYDDGSSGTVLYYAWLDTADGTPSAVSATGTVSLLDSAGAVNQCYQPGETLYVSVTDDDANTDDAAAETLTVLVASGTEASPETLSAVETDTASGVFTCSIAIDSSAAAGADGVLQAVYADVITVTYTDMLDGFGDTSDVAVTASFGATQFSGNITGTVTWTKSGAPYVITGDVVITGGNKLVIEPGVELAFEPLQDDQATGYNNGLCDIYVYGGELEAIGTETDSIRFRSGGGTPAAGDWGTIYFNGTTSGGELAYCRIGHATYGVYGYNNSSGSVTVRNCGVYGASSYGIYVNNTTGSYVIDSCALSRNGNDAVYMSYTYNAVVSACAITCAGNDGIYAQYPYTGGTVSITDNTITSTVSSASGIYLNGNPADLARNTVTGFQYGIRDNYGSASEPEYSFSGNTVTGCQTGMYLSSYAHPVVSGNTIDGNSAYAFYNTGVNDIDARANWWGGTLTAEMAADANPRDISGIYDVYDNASYGYVNYSAWLDTLGGTPTSTTASGVLAFNDGGGAAEIGFAPGDTVYISLDEADADTGSATVETLAVTVYSGTETGGETVTLIETGAHTGVFSGILVVDTGAVASDGTLQASFYDVVTASYADAANDFGDPDTVIATAYFMGTVVNGDIAGSETWTADGNPYFMTGDVRVGAGDVLTIEAGTEVLVADGYDDTEGGNDNSRSEFYLTSGGHLSVNGTAGDSVRFASMAAVPAAGDWYGIFVNGASSADITCASIADAFYGLYTNSNTADSVVLRNSSVTGGNYGAYLSWCGANAYVLLDSCTLEDQVSYGVYMYYARNITVSNCGISGTGNTGIYVQYYSNDDSSCTISGNTLAGSGSNYGIYCNRQRVTISNNAISNWSYGIYYYNSEYRAGAPVFSGNVISGGSRAVSMDGYAFADLHDNSFTGQSQYQVYTSSTYDVDATGNYWGGATTAEMETGGNPKNIAGIYDEYENAAYGLVDYSAWLDTTGGIPATGNATGRSFFTDAAGDTVGFIAAGDSLFAGLSDPDLDTNAAAVETVRVLITSPAETETLTLVETGVNTGVFTAYVPVDSNGTAAADGVLQAVRNDSLTLIYHDATTVYGIPDTVAGTVLFSPSLYSGSITADVAWDAANSPYILTGDVTVESGVTLTIGAGVEVYALPDNDDMNGGRSASLTEIRIASGGRLAVNGTAAQPVVLSVLADDPQQGDWNGLYLLNSATARVSHCDIAYGDYDVYLNTAQSDSIVFRNCDFGYATSAVYVTTVSGAQVVFDSCRIHHTGGYGMYLSYARTTDVSGCTFEHTGNHGVWIDYPYDTDSTTYITDNTFTGSGSYAAVYSYRARPVIADNAMDGWQYGVYCNNTTGTAYTDQDISGNVITGGQYGVYLNSYSRPQVNGNAITGQSGYQLYNATGYDQDVRYNWWGDATTAAMAAGSYPQDIAGIYDHYDNTSYGTVYYFGWLDAPGGTPSDSTASGIVTLADAAGEAQISFMDGETLYVRLADADLNADTGAVDAATAYLASSTETVPETVALAETGANTGLFVGIIVVDSSAVPAADGVLQARPDDLLIATYSDAANGFGVAATAADTARFGITPVSGGLSGLVTWEREDSPFLVTGDIEVGDGDTLVIEPGVRVYFMDGQDDRASGYNTSSCEIYVNGGHLEAVGTAVDSILLRSYAASPATGDWYGITLGSGATMDLAYCNSEYAYYGVYASSVDAESVTVRHSRFYRNYRSLYLNGGTAAGACVFEGNHVVRPSEYGAYLVSVLADVRIADCVFDTTGNTAVYVNGYTTGDNVAVDGNSFNGRGSSIAVYAYRSRPAITDNVISNYQYGVYCYQNSASYDYEFDVTGNTITDGQYGIYLQYNVMPRINRNNIYGQSLYQVYCAGNYDIDARYNYWGAAATDSMNAGGNPKDIGGIYDYHDNASYGEVIYFAWLDTVDGVPADSSMTGVITFTDNAGAAKYSYTAGDSVFVRLDDSDADSDPLAADTVRLYLASSTEAVPETVLAVETGVGTGIFTGTIALDSSVTDTADGMLQVVFGDSVTATYHDARDGFGVTDTVTETASFMATMVSGRLAGANTWRASGSPYVVTGDVMLYAGDELTIEPGTEVYFASGDDQSTGSDAQRSEIYINGGYLNAAGTAADSILLTSLADTPAAGDWQGIYVVNNGSADITYADIRYAAYPVYVSSLDRGVGLSHSSLRYGTYGINAATIDAGGSMDVDSCRITNMSQYGAYFYNGRNTTFSNNLIDSAGTYGLYFYYPYVDINTVVSNNTILGHGSGRGIYTYRCQPDLDGNTVENWQYGIYAYLNSQTAEQQQTISNNVVYGGTYGIYTYLYSSPVIRYNDIYGQSSYQLYNRSSYDIDAKYNYWGEATTAEIEAGDNPKDILGIYDSYDNASYGTVNYAAWLDTIDGTATPAGNSGTVTLVDASDDVLYGAWFGDSAWVLVDDPDENTDPAVAETLTAFMGSSTESAVEPVGLYETGPNTGVFRGGLPIARSDTAVSGDGVIQGLSEDDLFAVYYDDTDDYGNTDTVSALALFGVNVKYGNLDGSHYWAAADGPYLVTGDIQLNSSGDRLEIEPGTRVLFRYDTDVMAAGNNSTLSEIYLSGNAQLYAVGTDSLPITFTSSSPVPEQGDWNGIYVNGGAGVDLAYCDIGYASYGVYGNYTTGYANTVRNCEITDATYGLYIYRTYSSASWDISGNRIARTSSYGIYARYISDVAIDGNTIDTTSNYGMYLYYDYYDYAGYDTSNSVTRNVLNGTGGSVGMYFNYIRPYVADNVINNYSTGMQFNLQATDSVFQTVEFNTVNSGSYGIYVDGYAAPTLRYNNLPDAATYGVYCRSSNDVDVRYNWWGTDRTAYLDSTAHPANQTFIYDSLDNATYGTVDYDGWLPEAASHAPVVSSAAADTAVEDVAFTYVAEYYDLDGDVPAVSYADVPAWLTVAGDTVSGTPLEGYGDTSFTVIATDGAYADTHVVALTVLPVNDPPVVTSATVDTASEDIAFSYVMTAADPDNIPLMTAEGLPSWLSVTGDTVHGTPTEGIGDTVFTVIAADTQYADTITVSLVVLPVNDPPAVTSAATALAVEMIPFSYVATASDTDDVPVITVEDLPSWLSVTGDTVSGTPSVDQADTSFTVIASDGEYADTVTVAVTVQDSNNAPVITSAAVDTATEDIAYAYVVTATDADANVVTVSVTGLPGWLSVTGDTVSGTPLEGDGDTSFTVIASDGYASDTLAVALAVLPVNDPPAVTVAAADTAYEDQAFTYVAAATDPDDTPTLSFTAYPAWMSVSGDTVSGTPLEGDGDTSFTVVASDGEYADTLTVTVTVVPVNDPPVITSAASDSATEDVPYVYHVTATDPEDDSLAVSFANLPAWLSGAGDSLYGTPGEDHDGPNGFTVYVSDGEYTDTLTGVVTVAEVNDAPTILSATADTAYDDTLYTYVLSAYDPDNSVSYGFLAYPAWLTAAGNTIYGTPADWTPDTAFTVWVYDGEYGDTVTVALTVVTGTHEPANPFVASGNAITGVDDGSAAWADYDRDGDLDLVVSGYFWDAWSAQSRDTTELYDNDGDGNLTFRGDLRFTGVDDGCVVWGDYNGDGWPDLLVTGYHTATDSIISVLYSNDGDGSFTVLAGTPFMPVRWGSADWLDYNGDGRQDLFVTGYNASGYVSELYRNNGDSTFTDIDLGGVGRVHTGNAAWADYDRDGDLDLLLTGHGQEYQSGGASENVGELYENTGGGDSIALVPVSGLTLPALRYSRASWVDYDADGDMDIFLTGEVSTDVQQSAMFANNGDGTFTEDAGTGIGAVDHGQVAWGDYDNDGYPDAVMVGDNGGETVRVYRNNQDGTFTEPSNIDNLLPVMYAMASFADVDGNGALDLLYAGHNAATSVTQLMLNASTANTPPSAPAALDEWVDGPHAVLSWQGASDGTTPAAALSYNVMIGTAPGASDVLDPLADTANGLRLVTGPGNAGQDTAFHVYGLPLGTYYWQVQAVDNGFMSSGFSAQGTFTVTSETSAVNLPVNTVAHLPVTFTNPSGGLVLFSLAAAGTPAFVMDVLAQDGRSVYRHRHDGGAFSHTADLRHLPAGTYVVRLRTAHSLEFRKLVIE